MSDIIIPLATAIIGALIGTYGGAYFLSMRQEAKMDKVRSIAIKALAILEKYSQQSFRNAENDFNTSLSLVEKRTVLVALHKLGIPIGVPSDEAFNLRKVYFVDTIIDKDVLDDIILQIKKGYCDHLFYLDPDTHFTANYALYALRNAAKKYVTEVLAKSTLIHQHNLMSSPNNWETLFSLGELKPIMVFKEQVNIPLIFNTNGQPIKERIDSLIKEIDLGLWDSYLMWNYEAYQNARNQLKIGQLFTNPPTNKQTSFNIGQTNSAKKKGKTYTIDEKRAEHNNAYMKWDDDADRILCKLFDEGNSIDQLAEMFERGKGAIRSRLKKLGRIN